MPEPFLADADFELYVGDVLDVLRGLDAGSVDCVVTSPPYWGLRDYGTGAWLGGDPDCEHVGMFMRTAPPGSAKQASNQGASAVRSGDCSCGAHRLDRQLGLEETPEQYVGALLVVFRELRRVLAPHGTVWLNLGDSYAGGKQTGRTDEGPARVIGAIRGGPKRKVAKQDGLRAKNLVGIPWRVAFALQADGWYLRAEVIWAKLNPMPESASDRPTRAHEQVFMLTKRARYYFDQEAVREPWADARLGEPGYSPHYAGKRSGELAPGLSPPPGLREWPGIGKAHHEARAELSAHGHDESEPMAITHSGRNLRSVWSIATQAYSAAHFATYPEELVRRCLLAGCPERVCATCGKPSVRLVANERNGSDWRSGDRMQKGRGAEQRDPQLPPATVGWSDCGHDTWGPGVVLDPFMGSGTTALVARKHGRRSIGIELNPEYAALCAQRLNQLSLLAELFAAEPDDLLAELFDAVAT